jgi:hypothetical protein
MGERGRTKPIGQAWRSEISWALLRQKLCELASWWWSSQLGFWPCVTWWAIIEQFVMALLYFSMGGKTWNDFFWLCICVCGGNNMVTPAPNGCWDNLGGNNLRDQPPTKLGLLSNLQSLDLGDNQLSRLIPSRLDRLTSLKYLAASFPPCPVHRVGHNNIIGICLPLTLSPLWCCRQKSAMWIHS